MQLNPEQVAAIVRRALEEDLGAGDLTTEAMFPEPRPAAAAIFAKQRGIVAGLPVAAMTFHQLDPDMFWQASKAEGAAVSAGERVAELKGNLQAILKGERVALNFLQRMSGIATRTRMFVEAVRGCRAKILDTRKTAPGLRLLDKYAVHAGGGTNHRMGLYDGVLVKDNHLRAAGGVREAMRLLRRKLPPEQIEVEVCTRAEIEEALEAGAGRLLLDNMTLEEIRQAVALIDRRALIEVSGGVNLDNVRPIAATGVDFISIGALTHSAPALDFSLELTA
ncbi:MAG TPA: carboxylating nicotinate-nucleotide diphosphorylase [Terriglobia bacterium]|nr:carboxylating nicotinate-nucleotide diphosphorylase [Terriglobia bacterium]